MANGYSTSFEAPYMEDYRRRLLESGFGMANMPTQQYQQGIASFAPQETAEDKLLPDILTVYVFLIEIEASFTLANISGI